MTKPAIKVEGLWKEYVVGHAQPRHGTFYDLLTHSLMAPLNRLRKLGGQAEESERFWALQDVNFEVQPGEVVGVIGRNGAGKSTLLKILSRITAPSKGRIEVRGRLASLLEVGTGFHPELSGRENIFLNGAILGMTRKEVARKFDEIVAFAEIEKFIDTPVKRYSSGMYVRLAFAVAAHLDADVLLVDEVLAVGDAVFQNRCLGKMKSVHSEGRTVIFVSHNMAAISALCMRGILLDKGGVRFDGIADDAVRKYLSSAPMMQTGAIDLRDNLFRRANSEILLSEVVLRTGQGIQSGTHRCGDDLIIDLKLASGVYLKQAQFGIGFDDALGNRIFSVATYLSAQTLVDVTGGQIIRCEIESLSLPPGIYTLSLSAGNAQQPLLDAMDNAVAFEVVAADYYGNGKMPSHDTGRILMRSKWSQSNAQ